MPHWGHVITAEAASGNTLTMIVAPHWHMLLTVFFSMASGWIVAHLSHGGSLNPLFSNPHPGHKLHSATSAGKGIGAPLLVRRGGALRNADATYQHPHTHTEIVITPKLRPLFPKHLVMVHPSDHRPLASIAWLGAITAGPFFMGIATELHDTLGDAGCCAILIFESRRFI